MYSGLSPQDRLNNSTGEYSRDGDDKDVNNGDGLDNLHEEYLFEDKIPDQCENSSVSQSGKL